MTNLKHWSKAVKCPYCGKNAGLTDSKKIYGKSFGMIYLCFPCEAYVGVHERTYKPLGTLANQELRICRRVAHDVFDKLWKDEHMTRKDAYGWLAHALGLPVKDAHIAMFDLDLCKKVITVSYDYLKNYS